MNVRESSCSRPVIWFLLMVVGSLFVGGCGVRAVPGTAVPIELRETVGPGEILVFDAPVLEEGVRQILTEEYYVAGIDDVRCPPDEEVRVDHRFECEVMIDGNGRSVTITVLSDEGEYEVSPPE